MIRPLLFAACDLRYRDLYGAAFLNSARAAGHEAEVFCDEQVATMATRPHYISWRFRLLPEVLKKHPAVLALDIDSIVREPLEIGPEYDLGVFLRLNEDDPRMRVIGGLVYCTDRAMDFAQALADGMRDAVEWGDDQHLLWKTFEAMKDRYRIKKFTTRDMDWDTPTKARIFTAKGLQKINKPFMAEVAKWRKQAA